MFCMTCAVDARLDAQDQAANLAAFRCQRVRTHASNLPFSVIGTALVAMLLVGLLWPSVPAAALLGWLALVAATQVLRLAIGRWHRRSPVGRHTDAFWLACYRGSVLAHGLAWVLASQLPLPAGDALAEALRITVLIALVGGSFALLAFDLPAALCFGVPALGALCLHLWQLGLPVYQALSLAGLAALVFLAFTAHRASQVLRQYVALRAVEARQADALRRSEARLAEQSAALQLTLDSISQGMAMADASGRLVVFNRRARELLDLPPELDLDSIGAHGLRAFQAQRGDFPPGAYIDVHGQAQPLPSPDSQAGTPSVYVRRGRSGRLMEVRIRYLADGSEVRTFTDVTDSVQAQHSLTATKNEAERANQAKTQFLSGLSHELRTPLNAILGFGQLLQADLLHPLAEAHRRPVHEMLNGARHVLRLINDVLDLAVVESGKLQITLAPVPVRALLHSCLALLQPLADARSIALPLATGALPTPAGMGVVTVLADHTRLKQVLLNLLSNAIKYNRMGGAVRVACTAAPAGPGGQRLLRISVADDGPGLDAGQQARLFDPFERLDAGRSTVEGAGLGLAVSRSLVQAMDGSIGMHSARGQGSTFWVDLPLSASQALPPVVAAELPSAQGGGAEAAHATSPHPANNATNGVATSPAVLSSLDTVLYIEDNPVNVLLMEAMLALLGRPQVVVATTADDGLLQAQTLQPTLILLDIELPDMHGHEVLRRLQSQPACADIPVLAVSANAMPADIGNALAAGFAHYLTKPLELAQLRYAITATLAAAERALSAQSAEMARMAELPRMATH